MYLIVVCIKRTELKITYEMKKSSQYLIKSLQQNSDFQILMSEPQETQVKNESNEQKSEQRTQSKQVDPVQQNNQPQSSQNRQIKQQQEQSIKADAQDQKLSKKQSKQQSILKQLKQLNQTVIIDISVKKGRKQKFINHMNKIQSVQKDFQNIINEFSEQSKSSLYEKFSIIYYNLARLGQNQIALETAILLLQVSKSSRYLVVRWKMQLAAMRSSINHKSAYSVAVETLSKITQILEDLSHNLKQSKPKLSSFLQLVLKVIHSSKKNDFIWIHNTENNMKCFTDHIKQLMLSSSDLQNNQVLNSSESHTQLPTNPQTSIKIKPFFSGYDFQIADYMSLQKLEFNYIEKYNELSDVKEIAKQIVIYASICCFTQATESYYMGNYSLKYLHFKAVEIALLTVDKECTYVGFLLKILNDYYGTKMSQIREENSQLMEINELKRKMPRDKRQVSLINFSFPDQ